MPLLAIPNLSVARPGDILDKASGAIQRAGSRLLDLHSDEVHNRSVLTVTGPGDALIEAMMALAEVCKGIDLSAHEGVHPRVGTFDVCPFVPHEVSMDDAISAAHMAGTKIGNDVGIPVFFYGAASMRTETRELPDLRRGGLEGLIHRIAHGLSPDAGPSEVDPSVGVACVGARGPLIAFNVWLNASSDVAEAIASAVRERGRIRALGLPMGQGRCQVSMNLVAPGDVGIEDAFARVQTAAMERAADIIATEIIGLVPERYAPSPDATVTRLLVEPGHWLGSALDD